MSRTIVTQSSLVILQCCYKIRKVNESLPLSYIFSWFFFAHLQYKIKITCYPLSFCKLFTFSSSSPEPLSQFLFPFEKKWHIVLHLLVCRFVGRLVCTPSVARWKLPNLVQWNLLKSTWPILILRSHGQRSMSKLLVFKEMFSAQYLLIPFLESHQTWYNGWTCGVHDPFCF